MSDSDKVFDRAAEVKARVLFAIARHLCSGLRFLSDAAFVFVCACKPVLDGSRPVFSTRSILLFESFVVTATLLSSALRELDEGNDKKKERKSSDLMGFPAARFTATETPSVLHLFQSRRPTITASSHRPTGRQLQLPECLFIDGESRELNEKEGEGGACVVLLYETRFVTRFASSKQQR